NRSVSASRPRPTKASALSAEERLSPPWRSRVFSRSSRDSRWNQEGGWCRRFLVTSPQRARRFSPATVHARQHNEAVQISSQPHGRDALPRDPAWHVSKLVFGFFHGRSRVYSGYGICSRLWTCHAGSRGSASLPWGYTLYLIPYANACVQRRTRGSASHADGQSHLHRADIKPGSGYLTPLTA